MSDNKNGFDFNKAVEQIKDDRNLSIMTGGAAALVIGLFLPWYSVSFLGVSTSASPGLNSTGILLLVCAVAALGASLNVMKQDKKTMAIVAIVAGVLAVLVMLNNLPGNELGEVVDTGIGYWLGLAGSVAMTAGAVMRFRMPGKGSKPAAPKSDKSDSEN